MILLANNIINVQQEWPLEHTSYYNYLINKYGSDAALQNVHHYETREIKNSVGKVIVPEGLEVASDFSITFFDTGLGVQQTISTEIVTEITNEVYENRINDDKRNINVIKPRFVGLVIEEIEKAMKYPKEALSMFLRKLSKAKYKNIRIKKVIGTKKYWEIFSQYFGIKKSILF